MLSGQNSVAAGRTDGIGTEIILKKCTFSGEPVDIRGCVDLRSIRADGLEGMVIGKNEQYIGFP